MYILYDNTLQADTRKQKFTEYQLEPSEDTEYKDKWVSNCSVSYYVHFLSTWQGEESQKKEKGGGSWPTVWKEGEGQEKIIINLHIKSNIAMLLFDIRLDLY